MTSAAALAAPVMRRVFCAGLVVGLLAGCAGTKDTGPSEPAPPRAEAPPTSTAPPPPSPAPATPPARAGIPEPPSDAWKTAKSLRVGLVVGAASLLVSGSTDWTLIIPGSGIVVRESPGSNIRVARMGAGTIEVFRRGEAAPLWSGSPADTLVLQPTADGYAGWGGKWYRGSFRIFASSPDGLTLVNDVDLESYLRSVLPNEIGTPPVSDFEAVKAQAVAARSYTLSYLGRRAALGFDLHATVEDQVYGGTVRENAQSDRALDLTRGEILLSDGAPIRAVYSSACGGRTANVEDVWPWPWTPYLRSVRDADGPGNLPYCSLSGNFRWREEWTAEEFMTMLRQYGPLEKGGADVLEGNLLDVRVKSRGRSGRVEEVAISTTEGDWVIRGDRTRWAIRRPRQTTILRSAFFKVGVVRDRNGKPIKVVATGAGNGHGIGLCQWGAMGMARAGRRYDEILRHYYKRTQAFTLG